MTRTLVTGANGFLGGWVVRELLARGDEVHAVARRPWPRLVEGVASHVVDLLDAASRAELVRVVGCERLVHLAWETTHGMFWTSPDNERWAMATVELVAAFTAAGGSRALVTGTCAEYDWDHVHRAGSDCAEFTTPTRPTTPYGRAKLTALEALMANEATASRLVWARLFSPYGTGEAPARLLPSLADALLAGLPAVVEYGGLVRDYLHASDVAAALVALLDAPTTGPVNVASGTGVTLGALATQLGEAAGKPELVVVRDRAPEPPERLVADVGRLREELGFSPSTSLAAGLLEVVESARARARPRAADGGRGVGRPH